MGHPGIDAEAEGLLEGCEGPTRDERLALLDFLFGRGVSVEDARRAIASDRLPMLATERALAGEPKYSLRELSARSGVPVESLLDMRRAIGVARPDPDERLFGEQDLELAGVLARFLDAGFAPGSLLRTMRVLGRGLAHGARSMRETLAEAILGSGAGEHDIAVRAVRATDELLPLTGPLLYQVVRTHLLEQVRQEQITTAQLLSSERLPGTRHVTVCFADLVGFTRLGEQLSVEDLEGVAGDLEQMAADLVEPPVQLVKMIGDAVMLVGLEPTPTVETALRLVERAAARGDDGLPPLRAGLTWGPATNHSGDWYGQSVNLASRLTAAAPPGAVVCSEELRDAVGDGYAWTPVGRRRFKGIEEEVDVLEVRRNEVRSD